MDRLGKSIRFACMGLGALALTACSGVASQAGGNLTRVFVPPPPLGSSSSTITVVPARTSKKTPAEKSWGKSDTPGGQSSVQSADPVRATASRLSPTGTKSFYDFQANPAEHHDALPGRNAVSAPKMNGKKEVPVPVLYESGGTQSPQSPEEAPTGSAPSEQQFDPRLSS